MSVAAQQEQGLPQVRVPGEKARMERLCDLLALHYPGAGPKSTLWDQWLVTPALWPATADAERMRAAWRSALLGRRVSTDGYVATHQHASIAHPDGWPFPMWNQGPGNVGWHFSFAETAAPAWRPAEVDSPDAWSLDRAESGGVDPDAGWRIALTGRKSTVTSPAIDLDPAQAPFVQLRWGGGDDSRLEPALEWQRAGSVRWHRAELEAPGVSVVTQVVPLQGHAEWHGRITRLRLAFGNHERGGEVVLRALFGQYDTRHNVNSQALIRGSADYFLWTRDVRFLRQQMPRLRSALLHLLEEHAVQSEGTVVTTWPGHDGRAGFRVQRDGTKVLLPGRGIGSNYWDLLPFGRRDAYATILAFDALRTMEQLERSADAHPEWRIPAREDPRLEPGVLAAIRAAVERTSRSDFWNEDTGRFVACIDTDSVPHDYGFTFVNLEAIYYGLATAEQAESIMAWIAGRRYVEGDTARGRDIYHWRFAPRSTTRRNVDWYGWYWHDPESIPWGGQVQDGGAVLGFSYFDIMARLQVNGADDAWRRLRSILDWFGEVQGAGGYRAYYDGTRDGTLQGGGTAGGLGMDREFYESALVPRVILDGFLGFRPEPDGFSLDPRLPEDWPSLVVDGIHFQDRVLRIEVSALDVQIGARDEPAREITVRVEGVEHRWAGSRNLRIARRR